MAASLKKIDHLDISSVAHYDATLKASFSGYRKTLISLFPSARRVTLSEIDKGLTFTYYPVTLTVIDDADTHKTS